MKLRSEKGFTGIDIAISVIVLFIFVTVIALLIYNLNSTSKEVDLKAEAISIAIEEIEQVKNNGFKAYENLRESEGNNVVENNAQTRTDGFYKTITVQDYTDIAGNEEKIPDLVKKVTVKITYMFKAEEQIVELSTVLSKEN